MGAMGFNVARALRADFLTVGTFGEAFTGMRTYPEMPVRQIGGRWTDHFDRSTIQEAGMPTIYQSSGTIGFTTGSPRGSSFRLTTGAVIGNDANNGTFALGIYRTENGISSVTATITALLGQTLDTEMFVGLFDRTTIQVGGIAALPTTERHAGFILDRSVSANWRRSTADGTTQSVTTSSTAADTASHDFIITWTSGNVNFDVDTTDIGSNTANLPADTDALGFLVFIQTEAAAAKTIDVDRVILQFA